MCSSVVSIYGHKMKKNKQKVNGEVRARSLYKFKKKLSGVVAREWIPVIV